MKKLNSNVFEPSDQEERELMKSLEADEWHPVKDPDQQKKAAMLAASNTLIKDRRINLRLPKRITMKSRSEPFRKEFPIRL